jgi:hypothetical protein
MTINTRWHCDDYFWERGDTIPTSVFSLPVTIARKEEILCLEKRILFLPVYFLGIF